MRLRFAPGNPIVLASAITGPAGTLGIRMLLDTGAVTTMVDREVLVKIGLDPEGYRADIPITTASEVVYVPGLRVNALSVFGVSRKDFFLMGHTLPPSAPVDGLLGLDFLVGLRLTLDLRAGELTVEP